MIEGLMEWRKKGFKTQVEKTRTGHSPSLSPVATFPSSMDKLQPVFNKVEAVFVENENNPVSPWVATKRKAVHPTSTLAGDPCAFCVY